MPEHQNKPVWARSDVRDERKEERRWASTRKCPHGHFLVFKMRVFRMWGRAKHLKHAPKGVFFVFGGWETARVSCGRQEWRVGVFSMEGNMLGLLGVESKSVK